MAKFANICMAYFAVYIWCLFYANDGYVRYVPKRLRLKNRLRSYLAYLKAWMQSRWKLFNRMIKLWWATLAISQQTEKEFNIPPLFKDSEGAYRWIYVEEAILAKQASAKKSQTTIPFDTDSKTLGVDDRASAFISGHIKDFENLQSCDRGIQRGTANVSFEDDQGMVHNFKLPDSYYVPGVKDRLLSPQHFAQCLRAPRKGEAMCTTDADKIVLTWENGQYRRTIPVDPLTNVGTIRTAASYSNFVAYCAEAGFDSPEAEDDPITMDPHIISNEEDEENNGSASEPEGDEQAIIDLHLPNTSEQARNSTEPKIIEETEVDREHQARSDEAQLLDIHTQYNHVPFSKLREMAKQGTIPRKLAYCREPVCAACMYGKATKRQWRQKKSNKFEPAQAKEPGELVCVDQLKSPNPGFVAQMTGKLTKDRYNYATVFVDTFSAKGYVYLQKTQSSKETTEAKKAFEQECLKSGVQVKHYHADNGVFRSNDWEADCKRQQQRLTFAAVDAHQQNGHAEARIRRLQELTRTILSHATRKWPQEININLWPYALRLANESINATPNMKDQQKRSPDQIFSRSDVTANPKHWKHFGCPVYVLDPALRGSQRIFNKWKERSQVGIYLGRSPQHARSVALVLDPKTGLVSPQFHVKFDPNFDTIKQLYDPNKKHISLWQHKAGFITVSEQQGEQADTTSIVETLPSTGKQVEATTESLTGGPQEAAASAPHAQSAPHVHQQESPETAVSPSPHANHQARAQHEQQTRRPEASGPATAGESGATRRSGRERRPVQRLIEAVRTEIESNSDNSEIFTYKAMYPRDDSAEQQLIVDKTILAMKAKADPDTLYLHEARRQPDWENFREAMELEIDQQVNQGIYTLVKRSKVPAGATILNAVWQFRRKRDQRTNEIKKYKARCNIDGSKMKHGEHYEETYAPVAGWTAIRLILALVLLFNWKSVQLDYVLEYPQAPAIRDLYMEIPRGFTLDGVEDPKEYVLQVNRNIYGGKDSGRTWYLFLRDKLVNELNFQPSEYDDCIFYKGNMIYVLYTDDSILVGPDQDEIDACVREMGEVLDITVEGTLIDFLGVNIDRHDDNTIKLTQTRLIDQVLKDLRLEGDDVKTSQVPALSSKLLSRHPDLRPFDGHFDYRSVIGKLHYLVAGSRSEIAYAVHQCARFAHEPKMEHAKAVKLIGRYLKGTRTDGTILKPDPAKSLEVYVDADFAGNWDRDLAGIDRSTARSRHGFYICYGGIPIAWKSSLQQEIALSSTESEITGLSYALREAIPIINLLKEMKEKGFEIETKTKVHCKVFEDNSGAVEIAKYHKFRPRTKHLNNRLFHFRTYVTKGIISIHHIDTKNQPADILTKPLNERTFIRLRKMINGW